MPDKDVAPRAGVCLVGAFPPPVHGVSLVNVSMQNDLRQRGIDVLAIDLSPGSLSGSLIFRARRLGKVLRGLGSLLQPGLKRRARTIYLGLSGGYGQVYELAFVLLAKLRGLRIFMHHNSYRYVRKRRILSSMLFASAGRGAHHIVVCEDMAKRLRALYSHVGPVLVLSNAAMLPPVSVRRPRTQLMKVGFFSNVSYEKGIREFVEVISRLTTQCAAVKGVIAGPFATPEAQAFVFAAIKRGSNVAYLGPQYGEAKEAFLDGIDLLVFPSRYEHEADPLTVHEAMRCGVPVISSDRGCLAAVVGSDCGLLVRNDSDFVEIAVRQIGYWHNHPNEFELVSRGSLEKGARFEVELAAARAKAVSALIGEGNSSLAYP